MRLKDDGLRFGSLAETAARPEGARPDRESDPKRSGRVGITEGKRPEESRGNCVCGSVVSTMEVSVP